MSSFSTLTYVPPQTKGRMEYNVGLNNVVSNQTDGEKDVKITFPKLSFSLKDEKSSTKLLFSPWKDGNRTELLLSLGIASNIACGRHNADFIEDYFQVEDIPNAIITEEGVFFTLEDSMVAFNKVLRNIFLRFGASNQTAFLNEMKEGPDKVFAYLPYYRAFIRDSNFIIESDYPFPVVDSITIDSLEFENYSVLDKWETTNVISLPHVIDEGNSNDAGLSVIRGIQTVSSENSNLDLSTMQCYGIIPRGGIYYNLKDERLYYILTGNIVTQQVYSFLPWAAGEITSEIGYKGVYLDPQRTNLQILNSEPLYFSNGRYKNHTQDYLGVFKGFWYLESKKHYFSFPLSVKYKNNLDLFPVPDAPVSSATTIITTTSTLTDYRFIHISYDSGFFIPAYHIKGEFGGKQQLVNSNIIYTFDRIKDAAMFTSGDFYFDENAVQNMAYILTKMKYMGAYNVTIRVLGETYDGKVDVLNGSNFYIQMKFEYE